MEIKVYDRDIVKDDFVGSINLSLSSICNPKAASNIELNEPIKIVKKYSGRINVSALLKIKFKWEPYEADKQPPAPLDFDEHWVEEDNNIISTVTNEESGETETLNLSNAATAAAVTDEDSNTAMASVLGANCCYALGITVTEAQDLTKMCDPFCVIESDQIASHSTKTIKRTRNPKWNETFAFQIFQPNGKVFFKIYDWNRFTQSKNLNVQFSICIYIYMYMVC